MNPDDLILEPMFYMDDTRRAAHIVCPKCDKADKTVIAFEHAEKIINHIGCRRCHFRWKRTLLSMK